MRFRRWIPMVMLALPACAAVGNGSGIRALAGRELLLGSMNEVVSLDAGTGVVRFQGVGVPALGSWSSVFSTSPSGSASILEARDPMSGETLSTVEVPGELDVRVASPTGDLVALMPPLPEGASPWVPEPRASTHIVVADPSGVMEPRAYDLDGNLEPEAFSTDQSRLFLVSYVPPTSPEGYRVAALELVTGKLRDVGTGIKGLVETMSGTRLEQVASPDGSMLHTLYTTAPGAYAAHAQPGGRVVSFVHMLSLEGWWAHCFALPKPMWGGDAADQAMAVSPDGRLLYVIDTEQGLIAEMDTQRHGRVRIEPLELDSAAGTPTQATMTADGTLLVSAASRLVEIDTATLEQVGRWEAPGPVVALGSDASSIYVAMANQVQVLDVDRRPLGTLASPTIEDVAYVGAVSEESVS